ncbi:MAG: glucose-6-phosphate dehydrogenase assembly protein OpcA [Acidobacteria bacterium]|nr:glucose-6-phosphate dehydrogenase assembly protein OpcA [Acidobacteriota bacterium]
MTTVPARSLTATVVAVVSRDTRAEVAETLASLSKISGVRPIIVSLGDSCEPPLRDEDGAMVIDGLVPRYLNNAVASLRLSSLPTLAWWRAGGAAGLHDLAALVDRVVMDLEDPSDGWALVPGMAPLASVSDVRWARLTRWRDLIAQFFDMPEVRESFTADRLEVVGTDRHDARLLGGWLKARLPFADRLSVAAESGGSARVQSVRLSGPTGSLSVRLLPTGTCLETTVDMQAGHSSSRVVALGDQRLLSLLGQELRVRSRDLAFEDAVREAERL